MKYKDSGFSRMQDRQRNGAWENEKRAQASRISVFYRDHLSDKVEKEWWTSLAIEDMQKIEESYYGKISRQGICGQALCSSKIGKSGLNISIPNTSRIWRSIESLS